MATPTRSQDCDLWLWDGATEYEGRLVRFEERTFTARVRPVRQAGGTAVLGKRVPTSVLDLQRLFTERKFLAHFKGTVEGSLFEAAIANVQRSSDGDYDYLLDGRFTALDEKQLEILSRLPIEGAAEFLKRRAM